MEDKTMNLNSQKTTFHPLSPKSKIYSSHGTYKPPFSTNCVKSFEVLSHQFCLVLLRENLVVIIITMMLLLMMMMISSCWHSYTGYLVG